jgi:ribosomal protein L16/L10AE
MLFEVDGVSEQIARECLRLADAKLGIPTKLVARHGQ